MNKYMKAILIRGLIGTIIGGFINATFIFGLSLTSEELVLTTSILRFQYFGALAIGFYSAAVSIIFDIEEWSLLRQTITHGLLMTPYLPFAHYMGWMPGDLGGRFIFIGVYVLVYAIIWFSFKTYWTRKIRQMNLEIERMNSL